MSKKQAPVKATPEVKAAFKQINLRDIYLSLSKQQQEAAVNYFNSYNLAAWLYNEVCDQDCKNYIDQAIKYAREIQQMERIEDCETPDKVEEFVNDFNAKQDGE